MVLAESQSWPNEITLGLTSVFPGEITDNDSMGFFRSPNHETTLFVLSINVSLLRDRKRAHASYGFLNIVGYPQ